MSVGVIASHHVASFPVQFSGVSTAKAVPAQAQVNDIAIAVTSGDTGTTPTGWTLLSNSNSGGNVFQLLWKRLVLGDLGGTPFSGHKSATVATYREGSTSESVVVVSTLDTFPAWAGSNPSALVVRAVSAASNGDPTPHWAVTAGVNERGVIRNNTFWATGIADQSVDANGDVVAAPLTGALEFQRSFTIVLWPQVPAAEAFGVKFIGAFGVNGNPTIPAYVRTGDISVVARSGNAGNVLPSGWTQIETSNQGGNQTQVAYKRLVSGDLGGTLNFGGQYCTMSIYRRAGVATPTVVDVGTSGTFLSSITAAAVNGAGVGSMVVRCVGTASNSNPHPIWQSPATHRAQASSGGGDFWASSIGDQTADGSGNVASANCNFSGTSQHGRASLVITG